MKLPPLNALLAFHTAAKHQSFLKAAHEQHVTPGAISQHVKNLEAHTGLSLFDRSARGVTLTPDGLHLYQATTTSFTQLAGDIDRITESRRRDLRIRCSMLFMRHWMMPKLVQLESQMSDNTVAFTIARSSDDAETDIDCAVRLGTGDEWPGMRVERMMSADMIPVCGTSYPATYPMRVDDSAWIGQRLVHTWHSGNFTEPWTFWFGAAAAAVLPKTVNVQLRVHGLAYQAAIQGMGIALARASLIGADLESGALRVLDRPRSFESMSYYLVYSPSAARLAGFPQLRNWLLNEGAKSEAALELLNSSLQ